MPFHGLINTSFPNFLEPIITVSNSPGFGLWEETGAPGIISLCKRQVEPATHPEITQGSSCCCTADVATIKLEHQQKQEGMDVSLTKLEDMLRR